MAANFNNDVPDAALSEIEDNATRIVVCNAEPTDFTEATSTFNLATQTIDSSDMTINDGDVDGRKLTISEQADIDIATSGTATHVALVDFSGERVLLVTTCTSQAIVDTGTVTIPSWDFTIRKPVAS